MPTQTILDTPFVTLWYHDDRKIVHHKVHKFIFGHEFRNLLNKGAETLKKNQAQKWLSDDRNNSVLSKEDLEWSETQWAPATARAGWKFWAIVQPEKVLGQAAMQRLVTKYAALGVTASLFTNPTEAMTWLEQR
jgi:hypothetical protein